MHNVRMNTTRSDVRAGRLGVQRHAHPARPDALPRALFVAELLGRGLTYVARDEFEGTCEPGRLEGCGTPILIRCDGTAGEVEAFLHLRAGGLAFVDGGYGHVRVEVAAASRGAATAAAERLRETLANGPAPGERVSVAFWMRGEWGGDVRYRDIDAEPFAAIARNYPSAVRTALEQLMLTTCPERGRLILWRGEPGTGKSFALRALLRAWARWCSGHFIMDPEELLGRGGAYMLDVLTHDDADEQRWQLLILEDAGELIAADARAIAGQALSRLLNVADGLLGQGTRTLILITTNEPVGRLHPAARRPGRCLADLEFTAFSPAEANDWLLARGLTHPLDRPHTLADLFAHAAGTPVLATDVPEARFGFARALPATTPPAS